MNSLLIAGVAGIIAATIIGIVLVNRQSSDTLNNTSSATVRDFDTIRQEVASGKASLYDVRTSEEFASGYFDGAVNLSLQSIQGGTFPKVEKDSKVYVYCRSGNRSSQAVTELEKAGFTNVIDLGGLGDVEKIGGQLK